MYPHFPSLLFLGLFFLVGNAHIFRVFHGRLMGPLFMIGLGVWIFVRRMTAFGGLHNDGSPLYQWRLRRVISGSAWVTGTGIIWLLDALHIEKAVLAGLEMEGVRLEEL